VMRRPGQVDQAKSARLADALRRAKEHGGPLVCTTFGCHPGEGFEQGREPVAVVDRMLARSSLPSLRFRSPPVTSTPVGLGQVIEKETALPELPTLIADSQTLLTHFDGIVELTGRDREGCESVQCSQFDLLETHQPGQPQRRLVNGQWEVPAGGHLGSRSADSRNPGGRTGV